MLIFTKLTVPESSFSSHIFGIFAALILQNCGCYNIYLLPHFEAIKEFESSILEWLKLKCSYYEAQ